MIPDERRTQILTALHAKGYASVEELAKTVYVSIPTIRRDLIIMEKDGQIRRTHGGALYVSPDSGIPPLALRNQVHIEEKTKMDVRVSVLGHIQRGGSPSVQDRVKASQLGERAALALIAGQSDVVFGFNQGKVVSIDLHDAITNKKQLDSEFIRLAEELV